MNKEIEMTEKEKIIQELVEKFVGNIEAHLQKSFLNQVNKLSIKHLRVLSTIAVPITEEMRDNLKDIPSKMIKILKICASVKSAEEKGLYEIAEAQTPDIVPDDMD